MQQQTKPRSAFFYIDEPQYWASEGRHVTACRLRGYRAHPERYQLERIAPHRYRVTVRYYSNPAAILDTKGRLSLEYETLGDLIDEDMLLEAQEAI